MDEKVRLQFAKTLYRRLNEAVILKRADVRIGNWMPQLHFCHNNVQKWVRHNPQHKHVYGFVYFDFGGGILGYVQFAAHSAVELEDGTLVDITPHQASADYPFIRHIGTFEEFEAAAQLVKIDLPIDQIGE